MSGDASSFPVDKWRCAQEPIHIPGSVQPHGILLVLTQPDLTITHVSANIEPMLAIPVAEAIGAQLARIFGPEPASNLENAIRRGDPVAIINPMRFFIDVEGARVDFECVVHRSDGLVIVELEPYEQPTNPNKYDVFAHVRTPIARMEAARDVAELARRAADDVRAISGFDRVMIYRFDEDWNGDVIAESTSPAAPVAYFGLRFPAGDIPEQARLMYLKNPLRLIVDVAYTPARLVPETGPPVDLSRAVLRSVSPIHIEYLKNIGARSTLTVSIVVGGRLWGLIACHHLEPRRVDYVTRAACEFFGSMLAWQVGSRSQSGVFRNKLWASSLIASYDKCLVAQTDLADGLVSGAESLLELFGAQGLVVHFDGRFSRFGVTPEDDAIATQIAGELHHSGSDGVQANHRVGEIVPEVGNDAAGALLVSLSRTADEYLLFFRGEILESINWGGDVRLLVTESAGTLHPRSSFDLWKQIVRGRSLRWSEQDIANAHTLRERIFDRSRAIERRNAEERIRYLAHHDGLTKLPNRAAFHAKLKRLMAEAGRDDGILAVLFVDLDHFKVFNDSFGHAIGDRILQAAAARMTDAVRHDDIVARLGGDEFVIISPLAKESDADGVARKILAAIAEPLVVGDELEIQFTASVGVAVYPRDAADAESLLQHADLAMYRAKEQGRNSFQRFDVGDVGPTYERLSLERRIDQGLEQGEFVAFYQPIVCAKTGALVAFEALARWEHPERGLLPPSEFIAIAEESRSIIALGQAMLRMACTQGARWRRKDGFEELLVTVNVSARQFREEGFLDSVHNVVAETGLAPQGLQVELTESMLIGDEAYAVRTLRALGDAGITVSIDDFGTGYSSLSYLTRLPVHALKIDRSFVCDLTPQTEGGSIVRAIIAMAHSLKLKVIAEGVETSEQLDFLCAEGTDKIQGYLIGKPLSHADATAYIESFAPRPDFCLRGAIR